MCLTDTFWTNPQYRVTVVDADEGDADNTGTLIISLLQKDRRRMRSEGRGFLAIGYGIFKVGYRHIVNSSPSCPVSEILPVLYAQGQFWVPNFYSD